MNKLSIKNFKAFEDELTFTFDNHKSLLLYGENGAGKSSLFEALKIVFFRNKLQAQATASAVTPEDSQQLLNELWSSYNNKITNNDFHIHINDRDSTLFDASGYQAFLISMESLLAGSRINLIELLSQFYFPIDDIKAFCATNFQEIATQVNNGLITFRESVRIKIDEEDGYSVIEADERKKIERKSDLKKYFNEAKLNLIILLIVLNTVIRAARDDKKKVLVLDDVITSLDSSNRTFLVMYIFEKFYDAQVFVFTHNISFYNLIMYVLNEVHQASAPNWVFANLYEIENKHKLYNKLGIERVSTIKAAFLSLLNTGTEEEIESVGNRIRKKFETLLCEYAKLLMVGSVEDTKKILERLTKGQAVYYQHPNKTASDLIEEIEKIIADAAQDNRLQRISTAVEAYKNTDLHNCRKILNGLKLYQKVTMHPMSHAATGMPTFTIKEIEKSLDLLEKMEKYLKDMVNKDVVNI